MTSQNIGKKLKMARKRLNLKQSGVAEKAGISVNYYARIERDEENTTLDTLKKICQALKVKSTDILPF